MAAAPDADLRARLAHFHDAYRKAEAAGAACVALRKQLEALPFCPEHVDPQSEFEADNRHVSESRNATNYAPRIFAERLEREGFSKADFRRAMEALFSQGQIKIEEYGRKSDLRRRIAVV